jgi:hypothetical protein
VRTNEKTSFHSNTSVPHHLFLSSSHKKDTFIRPLDLQNNRMDFFSQGPSTKAADPEAIKAEEE